MRITALVGIALAACLNPPTGAGGDGGDAGDGDGPLGPCGPLGAALTGDLLSFSFEDDAETGVLHDRSSHRWDADATDVVITAGRFDDGLGLSLDSTVYLPDREQMFAGNRVTIQAWIRPDRLGRLQAIYSDLDDDDPVPAEVSFGLDREGALTFSSNDGTSEVEVDGGAGSVVESAVFTHVAVTWDSEMVRFYLGGELVAARPMAVTPSSQVRSYRIGRVNSSEVDSEHRLVGILDELQVSSCPRTAAQIRDSMGSRGTGAICGDGVIEQGETCEVGDLCCAPDQCVDVADGGDCRNDDATCMGGVCVTGDALQPIAPVVVYELDEQADAIAADSGVVSPQIDLQLETTTGWLEGGYSFRGSGAATAAAAEKVRISCDREFTGSDTEELTIEAWVKPVSVSQVGPIVVIGDEQEPILYLGQAGRTYVASVKTGYTNEDARPFIDSARGDATMALSHLVVTRSATGVRSFYVDGRLRSHNEIGGGFGWVTPGPLFVARSADPGGPRWSGDIYRIVIACRALSAIEVASRFGAGPSG